MTTYNVFRSGHNNAPGSKLLSFEADDMDAAIEEFGATLAEEFELDGVDDDISVLTTDTCMYQLVEDGTSPLSAADFVERG